MMPLSKDSIDRISENKAIHDRLAAQYDQAHPEIYNPTEQARIHAALTKAMAMIQTRATNPLVMDFGAGTGNLTRHLLDLGMRVLAADVSQGSLDRLQQKLDHPSKLQTAILNGCDLSGFADETFDMLATYSVLHHVPDYLAIIDEFVRVVKPGGVIMIDHEVCPSYWEHRPAYESYLDELGGNFLRTYKVVTSDSLVGRLRLNEKTIRWLRALRRTGIHIYGRLSDLLHLPRRHPNGGGDIHIFKHDHIEWDKIFQKLTTPCDTIKEEDYLVCRETEQPPPVWMNWHKSASDMRCIIARKKNRL